MTEATPRRTARVLPVNDQDEVLLLVIRTATGDEALMSVGGGVEEGETEREAAVRELAEEAGLRATPDDLLGPVWQGRHARPRIDGTTGDFETTFFALRATDDQTVSFDAHNPDERGYIVGHTWISPGRLASDVRARIPLLPHAAALAVAEVRGEEYVVPRVTGRVLPVNDDGEVLLLQDQDPAEPGVLRWGTIGGATEAGESPAEAAVREAHEETGIALSTGALVEVRRGTLHHGWNGVRFRSDSTFFAVSLDGATPVTFEHQEASEIGNVTAAAWFTPEALERAGGMVSDELPAIMAEAVAAVRGNLT